MPNPMRIRRERLPRGAPKYPKELQGHLYRFLASYFRDGMRMVTRSRQMARTSGYDEGLMRQLAFWEAALGVCRDMARRVKNRQRHLLEMSDTELQEIMNQWRITFTP